MKACTILFAGGGSLGHVTPSLAVAEEVRRKQPDTHIVFVTSERDDEKFLVDSYRYEHYTLPSAKFPRGLTVRYLTFPLLFPLSLLRSLRILQSTKPSMIFSKGGFISVPISLIGWMMRIPIVMHTSDSVPNLSDKVLMKISTKICTGFPMQDLHTPHIHTGNPVRSFITKGSKDAGCRITGFSGKKPVLLVAGGSQGSLVLNSAVKDNFGALLDRVDIIHLTGRRKGTDKTHARYWAREEVATDLPDLLAVADIVCTRAGAAALSEFAATKKAVITVPLTGVAHDHQRKNAEALVSVGAAYLLREEDLSNVPAVIDSLLHDTTMRTNMQNALHAFFPADASTKVAEVLLDVCDLNR